MTPWINATGIAAVLTALFSLRYRLWRSPRVLFAYFGFFFVVEFVVAAWILPEDTFGSALGWVCLAIASLVVIATYGVDRYERANGEDRDL